MVLKFNTARKTKIILGVFALLMTLFVVITLWGIKDMSPYFIGTILIVLSAIIFVEANVTKFFSKSQYKQLTMRDMFDGITSISAGAILILGISYLSLFPTAWNIAIATSLGRTAGIVVLVAGIFVTIHMFIPTEK